MGGSFYQSDDFNRSRKNILTLNSMEGFGDIFYPKRKVEKMGDGREKDGRWEIEVWVSSLKFSFVVTRDLKLQSSISHLSLSGFPPPAPLLLSVSF